MRYTLSFTINLLASIAQYIPYDALFEKIAGWSDAYCIPAHRDEPFF